MESMDKYSWRRRQTRGDVSKMGCHNNVTEQPWGCSAERSPTSAISGRVSPLISSRSFKELQDCFKATQGVDDVGPLSLALTVFFFYKVTTRHEQHRNAHSPPSFDGIYPRLYPSPAFSLFPPHLRRCFPHTRPHTIVCTSARCSSDACVFRCQTEEGFALLP